MEARAREYCFKISRQRPVLLTKLLLNISSRTIPSLSIPIFRFRAMSSSASTRSTPGSKSQDGRSSRSERPISIPRPSSSVILVSPQNTILMLHRVRTSTSFASASVFPGGNLSSFHDGEIPSPDHHLRHSDSLPYRIAAIRETFEESGILLAKPRTGTSSRSDTNNLIQLPDAVIQSCRVQIHSNKIQFQSWLSSIDAIPDTDGMIPFTRWLTPMTMVKRFTTQMYVYFMPIIEDDHNHDEIQSTPTAVHDGGIEHTAAEFLPAADWLAQARKNEIVLFPPQVLLLFLADRFLGATTAKLTGETINQADRKNRISDMIAARRRFEHFIRNEGDLNTPWSEKCISPVATFTNPRDDGRVLLGLDHPGPEIEASQPQSRTGTKEYRVLVKFTKDGPRDVEIVPTDSQQTKL